MQYTSACSMQHFRTTSYIKIHIVKSLLPIQTVPVIFVQYLASLLVILGLIFFTSLHTLKGPVCGRLRSKVMGLRFLIGSHLLHSFSSQSEASFIYGLELLEAGPGT